MPLNTNQQFTTFSGSVIVNVANPNLDGTGVVLPVYTASSTGNVIQKIVVQATSITTPGMVRIFIDKGAAGTFLVLEIPIWPRIRSGNIPATAIVRRTNIPLSNGDIIKASTQNAEPFNVFVFGTEWNNCECG
jgi:hypothetical protein